MDKSKTIEILEALASGCSPTTGEMVGNESILNERDVIRALQIAIDELKKMDSINAISNRQKKRLSREIDFFQKEKFNKMTEGAINQIKQQVKELGMTKLENLSEYVKNERVNHPRAYEPWSAKEKELLSNAIKFTNNLDLLSECFQRGKGSIESCGQKIIHLSQKMMENNQE